jgi:RHS repeat-associated protein
MFSRFSVNKRLQPVNMSAASPSGTIFSLNYDFHLGVTDNGNVRGITNNKDTSRSQTFGYDPLNRLISAKTTGSDCSQTTLNPNQTRYWGNSYSYDAWGNLLTKTVTQCGGEHLNVSAGVNNQLQGYGYDSAGNMTHDATANLNYSFDQANRITGANGFTYTYDADGNRLAKSNGSAGTLYWYMSPGIVAESDLSGNLQSEYVFFDGERVARRDLPGGAVSFYVSDFLKTTDVVTDAQGSIKNESDFYPWGGELQFLANDSNHYKFTGKERDSETGLDYFGARYYSNGLGRFITPDWSAKPATVPYAVLGDPQSLNLYTYVRNIPTSQIDADGHCPPCNVEEETGVIIPEEEAIGAGTATATAEVEATATTAVTGGGGFLSLLKGPPTPGLAVGVVVVFGPAMTFPQSVSSDWPKDENGNYVRFDGKTGQPQLGQARGADEDKSQSDDARDRARTNGGIAKPPKGVGSVPPDQRDPKRSATRAERQRLLDQQKGICPWCRKPTTVDKSATHHLRRHADGGRTKKSNLKVVCRKPCHVDIHK